MHFNKQKGFTLIEIAAVLLIMGILMGGITPLVNSWVEDRKIINDSSYTRAVGDAANRYIQDNYSALLSVATPTNPALITVPMLITANHLNAGSASTNSYGQTICVLVKEPVPGKLQSLLVTEGGEPLDDFDVTFYAKSLGGEGGFVRGVSTAIEGAGGSWSINVSDFHNLANDAGTRCDGVTGGNVQIETGHAFMALWFGGDEDNASTLYRDSVPSRPELNRMNTNIDMNTNDIDNAQNVNSDTINATVQATAPLFIDSDNTSLLLDPSGTSIVNRLDSSIIYDRDDPSYYLDPDGNSRIDVARPNYIEPQTTVTKGAACAPNGRISKDLTGKILSCQSGSWESNEQITNTVISSTISSPNAGSNTLSLGVHKYCAISYYFKDSKFGGYCQAYKSGSNWYLRAYKAGGDGAVTRCQATCF